MNTTYKQRASKKDSLSKGLKHMTIDLSKFRGNKSTSFVGRYQGESVRRDLKLDNYDKTMQLIEVKIPLGTTSFNPSFFLGLFYKSFKKLNGREGFLKKFKFVFDSSENEVLKDIINSNIDEAIRYAQNSFDDFKKGFRL